MASPDLTVYYDGACPLCRREIAFYERREHAGVIEWVDISRTPDAPAACGIAPTDALHRLHAVEAGGRVFSGARAFTAIWRRVPGFRVLGRLAARQPLIGLAEGGYRLFLRIRPAISRGIARIEATRTADRGPGRPE